MLQKSDPKVHPTSPAAEKMDNGISSATFELTNPPLLCPTCQSDLLFPEDTLTLPTNRTQLPNVWPHHFLMAVCYAVVNDGAQLLQYTTTQMCRRFAAEENGQWNFPQWCFSVTTPGPACQCKLSITKGWSATLWSMMVFLKSDPNFHPMPPGDSLLWKIDNGVSSASFLNFVGTIVWLTIPDLAWPDVKVTSYFWLSPKIGCKSPTNVSWWLASRSCASMLALITWRVKNVWLIEELWPCIPSLSTVISSGWPAITA